MAVRYLPIDGEEVSAQWLSVLKAMRADGVPFRVNEGHRTMARQTFFWNLWRAGRGNLAAFPSPFAPHIRTGRIDHAIDFWNDGAVMSWLANHGLNPVRTVRGESWHIEVPASKLTEFARKHGVENSPLRKLGRLRRIAASRLLKRRRLRAKEARSGKGPRWHRLDKAVGRSYRRVLGMWRRAKPGIQRDVLAAVLKDRDGNLD